MGQPGGAFGAVDRALNKTLHIRFALLQSSLQKIESADNDREHVIKVVRDAASELADGLHFLHLAQLLFGLGALPHLFGNPLLQSGVQRL